jgi:hypothetical protein
VTPDSSAGLHFVGRNSVPSLTAGLQYSATFVLASSGLRAAVEFFDGGAYRYATADLAAGVLVSADGALTAKLSGPDAFGFYTLAVTGTVASAAGTPRFTLFAADAGGLNFSGNGAQFLDVAFAQLEQGLPSSFMPTAGATTTRAADVIAPGAGLVYSNVPIVEPAYNAATTYAKDALVYDPATHNVYQSLIASNVGRGLTDTTAPVAWALRGATNRWAMLDQYNNTQTSNPEEIIVVVSPQAISRGLYIGNVDASEMRLSVVDLYKGLVYQEVQSQRVSTSGSSFYSWAFNRIRRKNWALSLKLPPYANALVTLCLRKPGGTAKCGMFAVGPVVDLGKTLMGLGAEIKDFSETTFNFDGTSKTTVRPWAKRISADISVDSDQVDAVYDALADYRQRNVVWVGSLKYGLSIAFGRYTSMKPVIKGTTRWEMSASIDGAV